ncbi:MAG TPA: GNAT family N-acetyltransferase [Vicinamibacterales bacterium]|nr:GNAT family N-acetyltransferase [Vicinamibacterales bacterium]
MTPGLVPATGAILDEILDETHPVWGEGLDRAGYARYNLAQLGTPWGRSHLHRVALIEGGRWVSTAKRYDLRARLRGREVGVLGIGAVFTRPEARRRGAASEVLRRLMDAGAADGASLALLFSEIGTGYYQRFGFRPVPVTQLVLTVADARRATASPAIAMRSGEPRDLPAIAEMNERQTAGSPFSLVRSPEYVAFAIAKKRLLAACGPRGRREVEFFVVEEGGRAAAYVVVL